MTRPIAVLRPEPGNAATADRIAALGLAAIRLPLFEVRALDWAPPDPAGFDALLLTSANAPRLAGPGLAALRRLPVFAVGEVTATVARAAGLDVTFTGSADGAALLSAAAGRGVRRALLLAGRDRAMADDPVIERAIAVYASIERDLAATDLLPLAGSVALIHSPRAARRFAELADTAGLDRATVRLAAISATAADAAGIGWDRITAATIPDDATLLDLARALAD
ncbi:MAG TPA: uroporphyrinogen-III synthase [Sphingomonas sp.]